MNPVWLIAKVTYKEIIRDRILYALIVFALLVMGLSLVLGQLSFAEQTRISINFGFTAMHISVVFLSVFVGSTLVAKELEKRTILTLLARPISRSSFLVGKFLGLTLIILCILLGLAVVLATVLAGYGISWNQDCTIALLGILLEAMVLLSLTLFFGVFLRPVLTVTFSLSFFLIGHWLDSLEFFATKSESSFFIVFNELSQRTLPNLERFNWRSFAITDLSAPAHLVFESTFYGIAWVVFLISCTGLIFRRRDFV